ncbi:MAG: aldo/keto reductase [Opitutaceae bacterium]|nr:aldo/keto reductase [Opitutaceae bacterium]
METVPVGRSSVRVPRIGLGGSPWGREIDEATSRDVLDYALEQGITLLDSGESYGGGNSHLYRINKFGVDDVREVTQEMHSSEKIIGRWMRDRKCRDRIQICTKFNTGGTADKIRVALAGSLERLQTDFIDIYMLHQPYPDVPIRETLEALTAEVKAGRIRAIGCSNFSAEQLREAHETSEKYGLARMDSTQPPFSLADARARKALLPYCERHQIASLIYSPLAAGFLAGKYTGSRDNIPKGTRFDIVPGHIDVYFSDQNFRVVENLRQLANEMNVPMVKLAMSWVFTYAGVSSVLIGARKRSQVDNALEAMAFRLDPAVKARMDSWLD